MIRICGHHVFNIIWAYGMGREHLGDETNGFTKVFREVMANPSVDVQVVVGVDSIYGPCRDNLNGRCQAYDGTIPDRKAIRRLGIEAGEVRNWNELVKLLTDRVRDKEDFLEIFDQRTLKGRFSYFKNGVDKLSTPKQRDGG